MSAEHEDKAILDGNRLFEILMQSGTKAITDMYKSIEEAQKVAEALAGIVPRSDEEKRYSEMKVTAYKAICLNSVEAYANHFLNDIKAYIQEEVSPESYASAQKADEEMMTKGPSSWQRLHDLIRRKEEASS